MPTYADAEQVIGDKRLIALYRYWQGKRGDRRMPSRADIDPSEIPTLLPIILLIDVLDAGDFRYRLVGTEIVRWIGGDITGRTFSEALYGGAYGDYITRVARDVVKERKPLYTEGGFVVNGDIDRHVRRLVMPLSADGKTANMILAGQTAIAAASKAQAVELPDDAPFNESIRVFLD